MADVVESTEIPGVWLIRPEVHSDDRGRFLETYRSSWLPFAAPMLQGNRSDSSPKVLRGLHYHRRQADLWFVQRGKVTTVIPVVNMPTLSRNSRLVGSLGTALLGAASPSCYPGVAGAAR